MTSTTPAKDYPYDRTDLEGWRLVVSEDSHGQHKWIYLGQDDPRRETWEQSQPAKYWLDLNLGAPELPEPKTPMEAARNGFEFYKRLQDEDGHWTGAYGGPMFLIPGLIIGLYVTGRSLRPEQIVEMRRYLFTKRRPEGGWGLHTAAPPTAFGTVMVYVALRLLGTDKDLPEMIEIRALIHKIGGAVRVPSWAKAWLSILGAYEWEGVNPVPPELWLLPDWVPFHPHRWWIHTRNVYIPLGYLYGVRFVGEITPLVEAIREEIYIDPYDSIDFSKHRNNVCELDIYQPHHPVLDGLNEILAVYEQCPLSPLRKMGVDRAYELVVMEDENTGYQTIGPVSKMFNMVCRWHRDGPESEAFKQHCAKIDDFLWMSGEGLMMTGTNGSQLWDAAFMSQALVETGLGEEKQNTEAVEGVLDWLDKCQMRENPKWYGKDYRHATKGAWPFSTLEQGYTVSDCAGEGLKAVIGLQSLSYTPSPVTPDRMKDCVDVLLTMQNPDGGFASYELIRGNKKMEWLNTAEVFGDIMVEYTYPECTTSSISALLHFLHVCPDYRRREINSCVDKAIKYVHDKQKPDGSWYGAWAICFTYATMFALESLSMAGETCENSESVRRACAFLAGKQMKDGGWGETYMSCVTAEYCQHEQSQVVQTAWAVLSLVYGRYTDKQVIRRAVDLIMSRQLRDGRWLQEDTEGIFNKNCAIDYPNYKFSFVIWALGRADKYLNES
ncbi:putative lanosterol synthase [Filobasidium floriforme]|uniref:putative lanosterol synthase n=1 Tax=Filobasidium floriforme TaxID=5210 RepID=UPI001E8E8B77|nr:putative lanosterol synthase [Filobasidium floriforme]KAH8090819.1 putative lanosterol synthase [Filobasidium floriforme]